MKNAMRVLAVGLIVCVAASARADDKPKNDAKDAKADNAKLIVGSWEVTSAEGGLPQGTTVEFTKDGKLKLSGKMGDNEFKAEGTYKVTGDAFDITLKVGDNEHSQKITIKKLTKDVLSTADENGMVVEMKRKK